MHPPLHLCVINLVIGTLYTVRGNINFGINRIIKGLEPVSKRLSPDTWLYSKRPLLALAEASAMSMGGPPDEALIDRVIFFLDEVIVYGKEMATIGSQAYIGFVKHTTIAEEARSLKALFYSSIEDRDRYVWLLPQCLWERIYYTLEQLSISFSGQMVEWHASFSPVSFSIRLV